METVIRAVCSGNERTSRSCSAVACGAYFSTQLRANGQAAAPPPSALCPQKEGSGPAGVVPSASPHGVAAASPPSQNKHRRSPSPGGRHARRSAGSTMARLLQVLPAKAAGGDDALLDMGNECFLYGKKRNDYLFSIFNALSILNCLMFYSPFLASSILLRIVDSKRPSISMALFRACS